MSLESTPAQPTSRRSRGLTLASGAALLLSFGLLGLNYLYVSHTVDLDDDRNPYLRWHSWSSAALAIGALLAPVAVALAIAAAGRSGSAVRAWLMAGFTLLAGAAGLYVRYKIHV